MKLQLLMLAVVIAVPVLVLGGWVTHVMWWVTMAMSENPDTGGEITLAILGTLVAPIGVIHGWMLWF